MLQIPAIIIGFIFAVTLLILNQTGAIAVVLEPFIKESSIYKQTVQGMIVLFVILPIGAFSSGVIASLLCKRQKLKAAITSIVAFLVIIGAVASLQSAIRKHQFSQELADQRTRALSHPSMEAQGLPALDSARPITILNQIESNAVITLPPHADLLVRVAAVDEVALNGQLNAELKVIVPGTIKREVIGLGNLARTKETSNDGRSIYEGPISYQNSFKASRAYLTVIGKDNIADLIEVELSN